jgi:hypothetical protein
MTSSTVTMKWHGDRVMRELERDVSARLHTVGVMVTSEIRSRLSDPAPPHSMPHEYPHAISGRLRNSVFYAVDEQNTSVGIGAAAEYAPFLLHGTKHMDEREFILRTVNDLKPRIIKIMTTPRKSLLARAIGAVSDFVFGSPGDFGAGFEE